MLAQLSKPADADAAKTNAGDPTRPGDTSQRLGLAREMLAERDAERAL